MSCTKPWVPIPCITQVPVNPHATYISEMVQTRKEEIVETIKMRKKSSQAPSEATRRRLVGRLRRKPIKATRLAGLCFLYSSVCLRTTMTCAGRPKYTRFAALPTSNQLSNSPLPSGAFFGLSS